jgi:hypothetical protein
LGSSKVLFCNSSFVSLSLSLSRSFSLSLALSLSLSLSPSSRTGYGTEEDSLGSVYALVPKQPKIDFAKRDANKGKILRMCAVVRVLQIQDVCLVAF